MNRFATAPCCVLLTVLMLAPNCLAQNYNKAKSTQKKADDQRVKNEKEDVKQAQDKLKNDQKELQDAQDALKKAQAKEQQAQKQLESARKQVESKHDKSTGVDKALTEQDAAQKDYDDLAAPVLKSLKATPEYQAASQKAEAARARLKTLREDKSLSDDARKKAVAATSQDSLAAGELEQKTLLADSQVKSAREKLTAAQKKVNDLRAKNRDAVESDPELKSAKQAWQTADKETDLAKNALAKVQQKVGGDKAKLASEQSQLQKAEMQDKQHANTTQNKKVKKK